MVMARICEKCGTINPRYREMCVSCAKIIAHSKCTRILKEDLGEIQQIVISRRQKISYFVCVFENYEMRVCSACPYYFSGFCSLLETSVSRCSIPVCQAILDVQYVYIMNKLRKFMNGVPLVCCNCYDFLDRRNQRKCISYEDDFYAHT